MSLQTKEKNLRIHLFLHYIHLRFNMFLFGVLLISYIMLFLYPLLLHKLS